jgi:hypothetical protein
MKTVIVNDETVQDSRLHIVGEIVRKNGCFIVTVRTQMQHEPLVLKLSSDSWNKALIDVRSMLCVMLACFQHQLGYPVKLPSDMAHMIKEIPNFIKYLDQYEGMSKN